MIKQEVLLSDIAKHIDEFIGFLSDVDVMIGLENYICASVYAVCNRASVMNCKIQEFQFRTRVSVLNCSVFEESLAIAKYHGEEFTAMVNACGMCMSRYCDACDIRFVYVGG